MTQAKPGALLDLDTLVERHFITIDGVAYDLRSPGELSVADSQRFGRWGKRIEALQLDETDAGLAELEELVAKVAKAILIDVPDEVYAGLSGTQRWAIIDLFTGLLWREKLKVAGAMETATGPVPAGIGSLIGAFSFPASPASTAARPRSGFTARLRRLFGLA